MSFNKEIELNISDAIVERPISFSVSKSKMQLYPPTFGKMQILKNLYFSMEVNRRYDYYINNHSLQL